MEESPRFQSHEEELRVLRERVAYMERELQARGEAPQVEELIRHEVKRLSTPPTPERGGHITVELSPDNNDEVIADFVSLMQQEGIASALAAIARLNNPHLLDDIHRFLIQYIKEGYVPLGLKERSTLSRELRYTLLQVQFPRVSKEDEDSKGEPPINHKAVLQFLQGISALRGISGRTGVHIAVELASPLSSESVVSYVAVPDEALELVSQQLRAAFPGVSLIPAPDDYNVFVEGGVSLMRKASLSRAPILPLTTAGEGVVDALRGMYIALSEIGPERGAAIQFIIQPGDGSFSHYGRRVIDALQEGESRSEALKIPRSQVGAAAKEIFSAIFKKRNEENLSKKQQTDTDTLALINEKLSTTTHDVVIRVVASSGTHPDATALIDRLTAPFSQFARGEGNALLFEPLYSGERDFTYRAFSSRYATALSVGELAVMMPLGSRGDVDLPELSQTKSIEIPAPLGLPSEGLLLGVNSFRGNERAIYLAPEDRLRHLYTIGQTGTGKSMFLKHLAVQDMLAGNGLCFIDPHGSDVLDLLSKVPPERYSDVIYFDPAHRERVFGLNLLEYDPAYPEQKSFVVNELLSIFKKLYSDSNPESMGPAFEQYFRNATQLVMEDPGSGSTMIDIGRVLSDSAFRDLKLSRSKNVVINQFWTKIATQAGGEAKLENIVPYITNKFDDFTSNDMMRPIIGQEKSTLRFRDIMDGRKILLVNLAKGRLGERNAHLLGLILVGKIFMAALSRVDSAGSLPPFYLYIDEFQNITTDSIAHILSEARKYGLGMTIAHQFMSQIPDDIHDAVFGNVGSIAAFRVGSEDAEDLLREFGDAFKGNDLMNIKGRNAHLRMLADGVPQPSFTLAVPTSPSGDRSQIDDLRTLSYLTYAKDRERVEEAIRRKMEY
ncbi:MAG: hypothetical protein Q8P93_02165 [bacterium]|nr:hypothetical protein [bacterium]